MPTKLNKSEARKRRKDEKDMEEEEEEQHIEGEEGAEDEEDEEDEEQEQDLYATLKVEKTATVQVIRRAYRHLALQHHPDRLPSSAPAKSAETGDSEEVDREAESRTALFQRISRAYAVLSDPDKRARYDRSGSVREAEGAGLGGEGGVDQWKAYMAQHFKTVTKAALDKERAAYQDSHAEMADLQRAYEVHKGQIEQIISDIPFATYEDEDRLIRAIQTLIDRQQLPLHPAFSRALKDTKGKERRRKQGKSEAKEAEQHARDLGLWDIFYGGATEQDLGALIKGRAGASHAQMMASLESKYGPAAKTASRKKRNIQALDLAGAMPSSDPAPPTDEEFDALQKKLFGGTAGAGDSRPTKRSKAKTKDRRK